MKKYVCAILAIALLTGCRPDSTSSSGNSTNHNQDPKVSTDDRGGNPTDIGGDGKGRSGSGRVGGPNGPAASSSDGPGTTGGGFVDENSKALLDLAVNDLARRLDIINPEAFKNIDKTWPTSRIKEMITNIRIKADETKQRNGRDLMFDYGTDEKGPYIAVLKPFFHAYASVSVKYGDQVDIQIMLTDVKSKILHEVAHHIFKHTGDKREVSVIEDEAERFATQAVLALQESLLYCHSSKSERIPHPLPEEIQAELDATKEEVTRLYSMDDEDQEKDRSKAEAEGKLESYLAIQKIANDLSARKELPFYVDQMVDQGENKSVHISAEAIFVLSNLSESQFSLVYATSEIDERERYQKVLNKRIEESDVFAGDTPLNFYLEKYLEGDKSLYDAIFYVENWFLDRSPKISCNLSIEQARHVTGLCENIYSPRSSQFNNYVSYSNSANFVYDGDKKTYQLNLKAIYEYQTLSFKKFTDVIETVTTFEDCQEIYHTISMK